MNRLLLGFLLLTSALRAVTALPFGGERVAATQLQVVPDRAGWTYLPGEKVIFRVRASWDQEPLRGVEIKYRVGSEMMPADERTAKLADGSAEIDGGTLTAPGFLRCIVTASVGGKTVRALATAGFSPEKIAATQREPEDFDRFWAEGKTALEQVPLDPRVELLPAESTGAINVYHVSVATLNAAGTGTARVYGILCEPKAPGKYPALLRVPGAGVRAYTGDRELAEKGFITLQIGVHGIPVNLAPEVYTSLATGALDAYNVLNLDQRDRYYYRRIYLGCLRANDFLVNRPAWDGRHLLVTGGSQGGQLSLVTAGLDSRVTAVAAFYPAYCDVTGYLHGRAGGWPHMFRPSPDGAPAPLATPERIATTGYYDAVNFARRIKAPGFYSWGYNDESCPPTSVFAAYNSISAPKQMLIALEMGHAATPEQTERAKEWLIAQGRR
ncbi:MAG: acetylxylan esterase [Candidatus Didemnitutus sp.]|nr:acetylxylan esterase [Candidatus Didemnitutus sp.]